jgi:SAM-dependent methyltransferase
VTTASSWDAEYRRGRYSGSPPEPFVEDILAAARAAGITDGLYVGCGNGRNLRPLVAGGLDLLGLDISAEAVRQLSALRPGRVVHGTVDSLPAGRTWPLVVGIQVFQHGNRSVAHRHVAAAQRRVAPGGLMAVRVNAVGTDVWPAHLVTAGDPDGSFSVRYTAGSKAGLDIHYFSAAALSELFAGWPAVLPPRTRQNRRKPPDPGQWTQWEAIWRAPD